MIGTAYILSWFLYFYAALHLQQDPNDPSKWVIVDTQLMNSSALGATEADGQPKRQRRHACTCPNCKIGGVEKSS